ncbi:hypothetical protein BMS3Abin17_00762 [archaeon BMS3Abin17]|nr:hypothetical protein BMS3Abin17_00762 [archaeon BMS3Abin17]HDZ60866.1 hypothetical protein [Candidatus Pacearchaeota archaeon]
MKKDKLNLLKKLVLINLLVLVIVGGVFALNEIGDRNSLKKGGNYVSINQPLSAKELVVLNPEIEYISYFDEFLNKSVAYVNIFGGIGSNFMINPEQIYEISVSKEINLNTPE